MRKALYIVSILLACIIITLSMTVMFLQSETIQNGLLRVATEQMSRALNTRVSIGHISYRWPAKLELNDVYIEDQQGDTMAYVGLAYAHFSPRALFDRSILFRKIEIDKVRAHAYKLPNGEYNYQWLIRAFTSEEEIHILDTTAIPEELKDYNIILPEIQVHDVEALYDQHEVAIGSIHVHAPYIHTLLDSVFIDIDIENARYQNILVNKIDAEITYKDSFLVTDLDIDSKPLKMSGQVETTDQLTSIRFCADIEDATMSTAEIQDLIGKIQQRPFSLSPEVHRLGEIHYRGHVEGTPCDIKLQGLFRTRLGVITTDAQIEADDTYRWMDFSGRVGTRHFQLGRMLSQQDVGSISAAIETNAHLEMNQFPAGQIRGMVEQFSYRGYDYQNLYLDCDVRDGLADGKITLHDPNASLDIVGEVQWSGELPSLKAEVDLHHFQPGMLHLTETLADLTAELHMDIAMSGSNPDNINGLLTIDSLYMHRSGLKDSILFRQSQIELTSHERHKKFLFTNDLFTAKVEGDFEYATLPTTFAKLAVDHVPGLFNTAKAREILAKPSNNSLEGYIFGHELQHLQYFLDLPIRVGDYPVLKFFLNEPLHTWGVQGHISEIKSIDDKIKNLTIDANNLNGSGNVSLSADYANGNYTLCCISRGDSIDTRLNATGDSALVGGNFHMVTHIQQDRGQLRLQAKIDSSMIVFNDSTYHIAPSSILYTARDTTIWIDHFHVGTTSQFVDANGTISSRITDTLRVELGKVKGGYILSYILPEETLVVNGLVSGHASLYGILSKPTFDADVVLRDVGLNNCRFGDAYARLYLSEDRKNLIIQADIRDSAVSIYAGADSTLVAHIDGLVDLVNSETEWGLNIHTYSIPLAFIRHWTDSYLTGYGGCVSGDVRVFGRGSDTWVIARALPHDAYITIPYTGCSYFINDSCFLDSTAIRFPHMTLRDEENNPLYLDGILHHQSFTDFRFNIGLDLDKALAINLPDRAGELLQGHVYAGGKVRITGDESVVRLDADVRTEGDSRFRISIDGASSASTNGFITFVDHNTVRVEPIGPDYSIRVKPMEKEHSALPTKFLMGLNVEANRNLLFQLVLNDKTGDMIQAYGSGALRMHYDDSQSKFHLTGTYELDGGTLGFTLGGTFRRNFTIASGSEIVFSGEPANPQLNVTAKYRVTASLRELFGSETSVISKARSSIPVDVCISLSGTLDDPTIRFALEFPSADDNIRQQVAAIINTDEMLMRQVVYLIAFGTFYTPDYMKTTGTVTGMNEGFSLLSSTITGQINSWLSKLTNKVSLGVNIRNEGGFSNAESTQEYEAQFQIQPISRIIINGNLGYRLSQVSNQPFFGDVDVEFLLTENGKFRLKGFTHMVDKYSLRQNNASTIQGVGFVFKHDFNWFKDKYIPDSTQIHGDTLRISH